MHTRGGLVAAKTVSGTALGFALSKIGFADHAELNRMFTFQDLRMLFAFTGAVAIAALLSALFLRQRQPRERIHAGVVPGAVLFGIGRAIPGGCPAIPLVQVANGYLPAMISIAGIVSGILVYRWVNARYLHLDQGGCGQ